VQAESEQGAFLNREAYAALAASIRRGGSDDILITALHITAVAASTGMTI
jgi:hypothetical protein